MRWWMITKLIKCQIIVRSILNLHSALFHLCCSKTGRQFFFLKTCSWSPVSTIKHPYHFCGITFPNKVWLTYWTEKNNPHSDFLADSTVLHYTTQMFCALPIFSHTESWKQKHALLRVNFYSFIKDILEWNWLFHLFCECMKLKKKISLGVLWCYWLEYF